MKVVRATFENIKIYFYVYMYIDKQLLDQIYTRTPLVFDARVGCKPNQRNLAFSFITNII